MPADGPGPVRILLADDHTLLREAMRDMLTAEVDFRVVGEAADGQAAVALTGRLRPDVLLLDVEMPRSVPTETVRQVRAVSPGTRVLVLSMHDSPHVVRDMLDSGAVGFLHKTVGRHAVAAAIRAAAAAGAGGRRLLMAVSQEVLDADGDRASPLSPRERQVLELVATARSNRQIATRLGITEATVKRHLRNAFEKLGAVSRLDAVNKAAAAGLIRAASSTDRGDFRHSGR